MDGADFVLYSVNGGRVNEVWFPNASSCDDTGRSILNEQVPAGIKMVEQMVEANPGINAPPELMETEDIKRVVRWKTLLLPLPLRGWKF